MSCALPGEGRWSRRSRSIWPPRLRTRSQSPWLPVGGIELPVEIVVGGHEFLEIPGLGEFLLQGDGTVQLANQVLRVFQRQRLDDFQLQRLAQEMRLLRRKRHSASMDMVAVAETGSAPCCRGRCVNALAIRNHPSPPLPL